MNITIYSTPTCPHCVHAKAFFKEKNLPFTDYNVAEDQEKAQEMIKRSGQMGVPVIFVDDKMFIGFDRNEIEEALK